MNIHLIAHNITSVMSTLLLLGVSLFSFLNGRNKITNITFAFSALFVVIFTISHVIGVNVTNPDLSKFFLMFNLSLFFIGSFLVHSVIYMIGKEKENKWTIILIHLSAIIIVIFFSIFPDIFLLSSVPKMYFPNYYNPGILNWIRVPFLYGVCVPYSIYLLFKTRKEASSEIKKNQYKYLIITLIVAFIPGFVPNFLIYNIPIDPLIGMLFPLIFIPPFLYGAIKYELFDVKIVAKQAFFYAIGIIIVGGIIILLNFSNGIITSFLPNYPTWVTAVISAVFFVTISTVVWKTLRENDLLKYEFLTTVTHKFRTPLTGIKWAIENLKNYQLTPEMSTQVGYIKNANEKLIELTDLLVTTSEAEHSSYKYKFEKNDISKAVENVLESVSDQIKAKQLNITESIETGIETKCDLARIKFVIQTLIENAIHYTKDNGIISIGFKKNSEDMIFSIHDTGMGISKEEFNLIFSKFYRTHEARKADTEGMGIGLFIAKEIISRHKGKIWANSEGLEKGSTFSFSLPLNNKY